jgi:hypothetical protein
MRDGYCTIKRKGSKEYHDDVIIRSEQEEYAAQIDVHNSLAESLDCVAFKECERMESPSSGLVLIKKVRKIKHKLKVMNSVTSRMYTVACTQKYSGDVHADIELSVEYVGALDSNAVGSELSLIDTLKDVRSIMKSVQSCLPVESGAFA